MRVLDTHLGSGSSRIAARRFGVDFVGIEKNPEYFRQQEERYQAVFGLFS
jgi:site-specific DNA-methyltransferase (adenine-specific)